MSSHSPLAPSSAARWVVCPGSVSMEAGFPEEPSDESRNGDAAHWALAEVLQGRAVDVGTVAPNGVLLTVEHMEAVDVAVDSVASAGRATMLVEQTVQIPRVHPECSGTPDLSWWAIGSRPTLHVRDFKYGHRFVPADGNWQLIAYAAGILSTTRYDDQVVDVTLGIIQPRCYAGAPVREWTVPASDLRGPINQLRNAAEEAMSPNPRCVPNPECRDCRARHACPALAKDAYRSAALSEAAIPFELPPAAAGLELRMLHEARERLGARISGLESEVESHIRKGVAVPWWRMERSAGREDWKPGMQAQVLELGNLMGVPVARPVEPVTPNQARKAGLDPELVAAFAHRPPAGVKLVPDDGSQAARVFGKQTGGAV